MDEQLPAWRKEVHETFQHARGELRAILSALDQILSGSGHSNTTCSDSTYRDHFPEFNQSSYEPDPLLSASAALPPLEPMPPTTDFSDRLSQLKQQLNQRLRERPNIDNSNTNESPSS